MISFVPFLINALSNNDCFPQCFKNQTGRRSKFSSPFWAGYQLDRCWTVWADGWIVEPLEPGGFWRTGQLNTPIFFFTKWATPSRPNINCLPFFFFWQNGLYSLLNPILNAHTHLVKWVLNQGLCHKVQQPLGLNLAKWALNHGLCHKVQQPLWYHLFHF